MEVVEDEAKTRTRRRRSIRNLREGLPDLAQSEEERFGSLWVDTDEPVRKRKKRRSSLFAGLSDLQRSPLKETEPTPNEFEHLDTTVVSKSKSGLLTVEELGGHVEEASEVVEQAPIADDCNNGLSNLAVEKRSELTSSILSGGAEEKLLNEYSKHLNEVTSVEENLSREKKERAEDDNSSVRRDSLPHTSASSTPNISLSEVSPSSMSPDFPMSPSLAAIFHPDHRFEKPADTQALKSMHSLNERYVSADSDINLNLSDKENNLGNYISDQEEKRSPSFLSLCKSIADKVVTFVKTSPSFLVGSSLATGADAVTPGPMVLQDCSRDCNTGEWSGGDANPCDLDGSYIENKGNLRARVDQSLEKMEAEITASMAAPKQSRNALSEKVCGNLVQPVLMCESFNAECSVKSVNRCDTNLSSSAKKRRERKTFFDTFEAVTKALQNDGPDPVDAVCSVAERTVSITIKERKSGKQSQIIKCLSTQLMNGNDKSEAIVTDKVMVEQDRGSSKCGSESRNTTDFGPGCKSSQDSYKGCAQARNSESMEEQKAVGRIASSSLRKKEDIVQEERLDMSADHCLLHMAASSPCSADMSADHCQLHMATPSPGHADMSADHCLLHMAASPTGNTDSSVVLHGQSDLALAQADEQGNVEEAVLCSMEIARAVEKGADQPETPEPHATQPKTSEPILNESKSPFADQETPSLERILLDTQDQGVQKRKRKHQLPVKMFTEKAKITEDTEKNSVIVVGHKNVKSKSVASKRKSRQISMEKSTENVLKEAPLSLYSGTKRKKKGTSTAASEPSSQQASSIEEKISKLSIGPGNGSKASKSSSHKSESRKTRHRSVKVNEADTEVAVLEKIERDNESTGSVKCPLVEHQPNANLESTVDDLLIWASTDSNEIKLLEQPEKTAIKRKKRRSSNFEDLQASRRVDDGDEVQMSRLTDDISQVQLAETVTKTLTPELEQTEQLLSPAKREPSEDSIAPKRQRRRSAESASLRIQLLESEESNSPEASNSDLVTGLKGSRKRRADSKLSDEDLALLYRNKMFVKPEERRPWQTIFESPAITGDVYGKKRMQRFIDFDKPSQLKLRRRQQRAMKNGWDVRKRRKSELADTEVQAKLDALQQELDDSGLVEQLTDIVQTK